MRADYIFFGVCFLCVAVVFTKTYITYRIQEARSRSAAKDDYITPSLSIAEGFSALMERRGLERFLMRDYVPPVKLSRIDLAYIDDAQTKLDEILADMLKFLELPYLVRLNVEHDAGKKEAGLYHNVAGGRIITLRIRPYYAHNNVMAILCHEVTHYFMEHNRLNWNDTELNEQRTDIVANLIGFNKIMIKGYREIPEITSVWPILRMNRHKIGYILAKDCRDIRDFLQTYRNNSKNKQR